MAARKRPTPQDAVTARQVLLDGLAHGTEVSELLGELAPLHPRNNTFPGGGNPAWLLTRWTGAVPARPTQWHWRGSGAGSCPSARSHGRQNKKLQFAVLAAAA